MENWTQLLMDCKPSPSSLKNSYYHGTCMEPLVAYTIGDVLDAAAKENPDHVVFRTHEFHEQITLLELKRRADEVSKALLASGLQRGDIVFFVGITDIEYFVLYFAIIQIGLVFLYPQLDNPVEKDTSTYLKNKPAAIFIGRQHKAVSVKLIAEYQKKHNFAGCKPVTTVLVNATISNSNFIDYKDFLKLGKDIPDTDYQTARRNVSIDDTAVLFVSSGTSSERMKIACATHHIIVNLSKFGHARVCPEYTNEVIGVLNPTNDDSGCVIQLVRTVYNRVVCVMGPPTMKLSPDDVEVFMSFVETEKITWYSGMPFELIHAMNSTNRHKYDLSTLRGGSLLGQVTRSETKKKLTEIFPDCLTMFGATEAFCGLSTSKKWSTIEQLTSTVGYGYPHCEIKLVNSNNAIVPIGEQGEICVRGWTVFNEYLNDQELTSKAKDISLNGWYHYGDICVMDKTGHVTYIGRKAECVRFKHFSDVVYPSVILNVVETNERIGNAKVIGIQSDEKGDDICLCVEPRDGCTVTEKELAEMLRDKIQENLLPDHYFIFDKLPRTGARRKIALKELQEIVSSKLRDMTNK